MDLVYPLRGGSRGQASEIATAMTSMGRIYLHLYLVRVHMSCSARQYLPVSSIGPNPVPRRPVRGLNLILGDSRRSNGLASRTLNHLVRQRRLWLLDRDEAPQGHLCRLDLRRRLVRRDGQRRQRKRPLGSIACYLSRRKHLDRLLDPPDHTMQKLYFAFVII